MAVPKLTPAQKLAINYYKAKLNLLHVLSPRLAAHEAFDLFTKPYGRPRRRRLTGWIQKAEPIKLVSSGLKLNGYKWRAQPENEKKLLIIHGFAGSVAAFDRYIGPALQQGYDVYAYEAPGHGKSEGSRLNTLIYAGVIENAMEAHGPFEAFLAHSLGGLSLMLALHRQKLTYRPRVVLIAPATESTTAANQFFSFLQLSEGLRQAFEQYVENRGGQPLSWYSISRVVPEIEADILWVHDEQDTTTPVKDVYPLVQQKFAHIHFYITSGLGHSGIYKDNKVRKKIIGFLADTSLNPPAA